jgi:hypothetical protein
MVTAVILVLIIYSQTHQKLPNSFTVYGKSFNFTYFATTEQQRETGLMNKTVTNSTFMLFVFPNKSIYSFWMYNTHYNLDMIWLNSSSVQNNGIITKIVHIQENATPCFDSSLCAVYTPSNVSNYVIEAKAGFIKSHNITIGTAIILGYR